jgi:fatty-acyl-CoA synthase
VGATYVHTGFFRPEVALAQLAEERCTIAIPAFETIWMAILDLPELPRTDLSALRLVFNIGLRERLIEMQQKLPDAIQVSGFGATESSSFVAVGDVDDSLEERVTTCGRPLPGLAVRIVNPDTGLDLPPGDVGEIVYRGWSTFLGYYNDPERTAAAMDDDGYFHSGDLGSLDEDGRLRFVSRLKDMLKVGGENVAAAEVEGHLVTHPAVLFAQVVSAPDARYTEVPAAFIQLKPGSETDEQDIIDHCLGRIATFKVPRYVRFVDEWPMSGTKIKKHLLRDRIADELAEASITEAPKMRAGGTAA